MEKKMKQIKNGVEEIIHNEDEKSEKEIMNKIIKMKIRIIFYWKKNG